MTLGCTRPAPAHADPAVAAIVAAFAHNQVVAIAEAHQLQEAGAFYLALVRDPEFQNTVNDIVIEFASGQSQPLLDRYVVNGDSLPPDTLRSIWRNTTKAMSWECPIYARWLAGIREVNRHLSPAKRIRVLAGDTPVDWSKVRTHADWAALGSNDVSFAHVIEDEVLAKHRKALVVLGSNHLARGGSLRDASENTTTRVESRYPGSMFVVLQFNGYPGGAPTEARIATERWAAPSLHALPGSWIGAMDLGNGGGKLESRADALLYLGSTDALHTVTPMFSELWTYDMDELDRRSWVEWGDSARARNFLGMGNASEFMRPSRAYGRARQVWIYTPSKYSRTGAPNNLLVAFDGGEYLTEIPLPAILDSLLQAKSIAPTVALLVDDSTSTVRLDDLANHERFADFLGKELMPWVQDGWNVSKDPKRTVITGSSAGGLAATFLALRRPDLFGNVFSQSGAFWRGAAGSSGPPFEWLTQQYASSPKRDVRIALEVGSTESRGAMNGSAPSILDANRRLRDVLEKKGYDVSYVEVPGGVHAPETWGPRLPAGIARLDAPERAP